MQTLDIECPSCGEVLELDAGFAGGVCRCSSCGTLMTVPSDAGKAESLIRPDTSTSLGSGGLSSMGVPDPSVRHRKPSARSSSPKQPSRHTRDEQETSTTIEAGEYRTASGKVIQVDANTRVPMAESKRKQVRTATTIGFFSIIAAIVIAVAIGIISIMGIGADAGKSNDDRRLTFDPAKNPYTLAFANAMGVPITDRTVVIVEASAYSKDWAEAAGDMLSVGLAQPTKEIETALIGAGDTPVLFADGVLRKLPIPPSEVRTWFDDLPSAGKGDVAAAMAKALELDPQTLIVIYGEAEMSEIQAWDDSLQDKTDVKVHTVHIGSHCPELEGWAAEHGGEAATWSVQDIDWLKNDADQSASDDH